MSFKTTLKTSFLFLSLIFLGLLLLSVNLCDAQYLPPYSGNPYNTYGSGLGNQNIPIVNPFMRTFIDPINFYNPYGYGTNSSSPYMFSGLYGLYGGYGGLYGGLYRPYGGLYGGFYGLYGGLYGMGNFIGLGLLNGPYGFGGLGFPWFF